MKTLRIALVGQPNVGKSSLINAITGASLHVGNFTGVTVERKEVIFTHLGYDVTMVDLPGLYSLKAYTPEEHVSKRYLIEEEYDLIINVVDANALSRNLTFTTQLLDQGKKTVIVVNMIDEIEAAGGSINTERLSTLLGVPVVAVSSKHKKGIENFLDTLITTAQNDSVPSKLFYDEKIEEEITALSEILAHDDMSAKQARFFAIRLLEEDEDFYKKIHDRPLFMRFVERYNQAVENLKIEFDEDDAFSVIQNNRVALVRGLVKETLYIERKESMTEKIDRYLIHPFLGLPLFLFFMWTLFQLTFTLGSLPQDAIEEGFGFISETLKSTLPESPFSEALTDGAIPAIGAVLMFLPNILILFLGINLLEQTGYMARSAFLLDGLLKRFGLQGKAFIPLVSGFGCSIPAYMAARTLKNPKDRIITMLVIGFFSCSARLPVYVLFIGAFFPNENAGNILFLIYIIGAVLALLMAKMLRLILFKGEPEPFVMEMPKYRLPSVKAVIRDLKIKALLFLRKAGLFIGLTGMLVWFLSAYPKNSIIEEEYAVKIAQSSIQEDKKLLENEQAMKLMEQSYIGTIGKAIEPLFAPLGFDWRLSVATVSGLAAKEVAVSTIATLYSLGEVDETDGGLIKTLREHIDTKTAIAFIIIIMIYSPCIAAMSTFWAEVPQIAWRTFYTLYPNIVAWLLAFGAFTFLEILGY